MNKKASILINKWREGEKARETKLFQSNFTENKNEKQKNSE